MTVKVNKEKFAHCTPDTVILGVNTLPVSGFSNLLQVLYLSLLFIQL